MQFSGGSITSWHCVVCGHQSLTKEAFQQHNEDHKLKAVQTRVASSCHTVDGGEINFSKNYYALLNTGEEVSAIVLHVARLCYEVDCCNSFYFCNNKFSRIRYFAAILFCDFAFPRTSGQIIRNHKSA